MQDSPLLWRVFELIYKVCVHFKSIFVFG